MKRKQRVLYQIGFANALEIIVDFGLGNTEMSHDLTQKQPLDVCWLFVTCNLLEGVHTVLLILTSVSFDPVFIVCLVRYARSYVLVVG